MAKYDAARVARTAIPFVDGTSGIEPPCDEFGWPLTSPSSAIPTMPKTLGPWVTQSLITVGTEPSDPTQLPDVACSEIKVIAHTDNAHPIYFGDELVNSADVAPWLAREGELLPGLSNANQCYVVAAAGHTGQKLHLQTR